GMVRCMRILYDWARSAGGSLASAEALNSVLANDPALPAGEAAHYWLPMVEAVVESDCDRFEVAFE
ncbi:MAG TPA: hypothetical protein VGY66_04160, partial [Gemmataceae bacterium]|nr:hypothetical protein [Gemmataceae bacterium]